MPEMHPARVAGIYRYPVKGLTPEPLPSVALGIGQTLPADRSYAIENGPSGFDPAAPQYFPKTRFLMLMRNERLAALHSRYEDDGNLLTISRDGLEAVRGDLKTSEGRAAIEQFFATNFADELRGPPRLLSGDGHSFSDVAKKVVSIVNLASVAELADLVGQPVHPLRFRANLYVEGWPAWHEFALLGKTVAIGGARLKVVKRIVRCAATNVDPDSAARDLDLPRALLQRYGHADCGVYAEVITGGTITPGDAVESLAQPRLI